MNLTLMERVAALETRATMQGIVLTILVALATLACGGAIAFLTL